MTRPFDTFDSENPDLSRYIPYQPKWEPGRWEYMDRQHAWAGHCDGRHPDPVERERLRNNEPRIQRIRDDANKITLAIFMVMLAGLAFFAGLIQAGWIR